MISQDGLVAAISGELSGFGGLLRCEQCRREVALGEVGDNTVIATKTQTCESGPPAQ